MKAFQLMTHRIDSSSEHTDISCLLGHLLTVTLAWQWHTYTHKQTLISHFLCILGGSRQRLGGHLPRSMGRAGEEVWVNREPRGTTGHTLMEISRELRFRLTHSWVFTDSWVFTEEDALSCVFSQAVKELSLVRKMKLERCIQTQKFSIKGIGLCFTQVLFLSLCC